MGNSVSIRSLFFSLFIFFASLDAYLFCILYVMEPGMITVYTHIWCLFCRRAFSNKNKIFAKEGGHCLRLGGTSRKRRRHAEGQVMGGRDANDATKAPSGRNSLYPTRQSPKWRTRGRQRHTRGAVRAASLLPHIHIHDIYTTVPQMAN